MEKRKTKYLLRINTKGVTERKIFGNIRSMTIYIHEHLEKIYIEYNRQMYNSYQVVKRHLSKIEENEIYKKNVKETNITIMKIEELTGYQGKNEEFVKEITK